MPRQAHITVSVEATTVGVSAHGSFDLAAGIELLLILPR
jgi:hypothetical protein